MQTNYFIYRKPEVNVTINKMPIYFKEIEFHGDESKGSVKFESYYEYDEVWGNNAKIEFDWFKKERIQFYHAKEVQISIETYNAVNYVVTNKERVWLNSHEFTYFFGNRTKIMRKRYYPENLIHGIFYCELTERQFNMHAIIIRDVYENYLPFILECFNSIVCH